ncbi:MAG: hypothetical protein H6619_03435 [Deltaproteobacteria bacterium]|nr:hypothetical protein [Deltaproteobacteria bacterium]
MKIRFILFAFLLPLVICNVSIAGTHKECVENKCQDVDHPDDDPLPDQCGEDSDCTTTCLQQTGGSWVDRGFFSSSECGPCTSGACKDKDSGDSCELKVGQAFSGAQSLTLGQRVHGKCGAETYCSSGTNYKGSCGMQCKCKMESKGTQLEDGFGNVDPLNFIFNQ